MFKRTGCKGLWTALTLALACGPGQPPDTGESESESASSGGSGDATGDATGLPPTTTGGPDTPTSSSTSEPGTTSGEPQGPVCAPAPTLARRLSNVQYVHTIEDLFPLLVLSAELPPEQVRIEGFEHLAEAQQSGPEVDAIYDAAAATIAAQVVEQGTGVLPCDVDGGPDPQGCGHAYLEELAPRAFRRPLTADELAGLLAGFDATLAEEGFAGAARRADGAAAIADFLQIEGTGGTPLPDQPEVIALDGFAVASRLSYYLWDRMPDAELFKAAGDGTLGTLAGLEQQARRLLDAPHARRATTRHVLRWLYLHALEDGEVLPDSVPQELRPSMRAELERMVDFVVFGGVPTLAALLDVPVGFPTTPWRRSTRCPRPRSISRRSSSTSCAAGAC
ncbi:DUF1592 domain-containing protein [Nannocystis pusilla]|uniref:DUF1592 domain-containing protein n=1 Tax=Nannocystis pusilla TaxID=889268 RepID=UPI003B7A68D8